MCVCVCLLYLHFSATLKRVARDQPVRQPKVVPSMHKMPSAASPETQVEPCQAEPSRAKAGCEWALIPSTHDAVGKYFAPPTARRIGSNPLSVCQLGGFFSFFLVGRWRRASGVHGRCLGLVRQKKNMYMPHTK